MDRREEEFWVAKIRREPWHNSCSVCGGTAEVSHPDGYGDQTYYCGEHEPPTLLTVLEEEEKE